MKNVRVATLTHDEHAVTLALLQTTRDTLHRVLTGPDNTRFTSEEFDAMVAMMLTLGTAIIAMKDAR